MIHRRSLLATTAGMLAMPAVLRAQTVQKLTFYYPIAVGGPLQTIMDGYCKDFQKETGIAVEPVYSGDYSQTLIKALAEVCVQRGYRRFEWSVLDWNEPSIRFYRSIGTVGMDEWKIQRLSGDALTRLATS